jgi:RNA polymerase sigma factor (sigma-70 family)
MAEHALTHSWDSQNAVARSTTGDEPDAWFDTTLRMSQGDRDAFLAFYDAFFDFMLQVAKRSTGRDEQTCLDLVHDAMLKAMRCMKPIPNEPQLKAFVRVLTQRIALDFLRREHRHAQLIHRWGVAQGSQELVSQEHEPAERIDEQARIAWLTAQLQVLDTDQQRLLDWRYRLGWTLQSIAFRLGLKTGAVDGRIRRAVERLRLLSEEETHE